MLKLASVNLNKGFANPRRRRELFRWLLKEKINVLIVQESSKIAPNLLQALEGYELQGGNTKTCAWVEERFEVPEPKQLTSFVQRIELDYVAVYNVYLDAYRQARRAEQLQQIEELLQGEGDRPLIVVGDFNLAPRTIDGLLDEAPSTFNSEIDRDPFHRILADVSLWDLLATDPPEFSIERVIAGRTSRFRCDLALSSDYFSAEVACRYDHIVRDDQLGFTDHSAILIELPVDLQRRPQQGFLFPLWDETKELDTWGRKYHPHKTAKVRPGPTPIARAIVRMVPANRILDFGCGRGADVMYYREMGFEAVGFDSHEPFGWSEAPEGFFDIVAIVFVLNVIADPWQRIKVLRRTAGYLAPDGIMVVATRSRHEIESRAAKGKWVRHHDGYWSQEDRGTFQKGIDAAEIEQLGRRVGLAPHSLRNTIEFGATTSHTVMSLSS